MAAIIRLHRCRDPLFRSHLYPIHHHFSTSSDPCPNSPGPETDSERQSSYFKDVKAYLQRESQPCMRPQTQRPLPFSNAAPTRAPPSKVASFQEIRKNLSELRRRSAAPPPSSSAASSQPLSLREIYMKNLTSQTDGSNSTSTSKSMPTAAGGKISFDIDKLRQMWEKTTSQGHQNDPSGKPMDPMSLASVFGKDKKDDVGKDNEASSARTVEFVRAYSYEEMGKKLQSLRPEKNNGKWFSLQELNDRLVKMRVLEEKEIEESGLWRSLSYKELRKCLLTKKESGTPSFMLKPPKEHLVEKARRPKEIRPSEQEEEDWRADRRAIMKKLLGENFYFQ